MQKINTGIKNFDDLIHGGFPKNSNILINGFPGSGKTLFGLEYIYHGAKEFSENGLFVSLEQSESDLIQQAKTMGYDMDKLIKSKKISLMYTPLDKMTREFIEDIKQKANEINAKRLVFDSLSLLVLNPLFLQDKKFSLVDGEKLIVAFNEQHFVYNFIKLIEQIDTTTIIIKGEYPNKSDNSISEFVCDGVISLKSVSMGKIHSRTLEIMKMRKTDCKGGIYPFKITKKGIIID